MTTSEANQNSLIFSARRSILELVRKSFSDGEGKENFLIMKITKTKKCFGTIASVVVFVNIFFLNATETHASICLLPDNIFVAAYEQGVFVDGFVVEHRITGNLMPCDTRPVVSERTENLQNSFAIVSQNLNQTVFSGVYQLLEGIAGWYPRENTLKQISSNSSELGRYKSEWQQKEREELRSAITQKWSVVVIIGAIVALAILWPWILVRIWPNLRRRLSWLLVVAILLQAPLALALILLGMSAWLDSFWKSAASISSIVLGLSILGEIIIIIVRIVRKIRSRKVVV